jgi:hypothetical protein
MEGQRGQGGRATGAPSLLPSLLLLTLQHFYCITLQNKSLPARRTILTPSLFSYPRILLPAL